MEQPEPVHVEIDPVTEPIEGTVTQPGSAPRRFAGWLELVGLLECARAGSMRTDPPDPAS